MRFIRFLFDSSKICKCCSFHVFTTVHDDDWSLVVVISIDQSNARTEKNINKVGTRTLLITKPHNMNKKFRIGRSIGRFSFFIHYFLLPKPNLSITIYIIHRELFIYSAKYTVKNSPCEYSRNNEMHTRKSQYRFLLL